MKHFMTKVVVKDEEVPLKQEKAFNGKWREDEK